MRNTSHKELARRFHELLSANGPALLRLAGSYTNCSSDREDLFQDIGLAIWKALRHFRGESSERTFIFRIAHNRAITYLARRRPLMTSHEDIELSDPGPSPEKGLHDKQRQTRLFQAIQQLPMDYRQVITLTLEGLSYAEIAEILGIGESNVGVRLTRARQMMRRLLEADK